MAHVQAKHKRPAVALAILNLDDFFEVLDVPITRIDFFILTCHGCGPGREVQMDLNVHRSILPAGIPTYATKKRMSL
jgi:hypothetical protein